MSTEASAPALRRPTTLLVVAAVIASLVTLLLEMRWGLHLKLPGHRALPGALALLVVAEAASPRLILVYAVVMSLAMIGLSGDPAVLLVPWLGLALVLVAAARARWRRQLWFTVVAGLAYGALRYGALSFAPHKTPEVVRALGHLLFGGLGGLIAALVVRTQRGLGSSEEERGA